MTRRTERRIIERAAAGGGGVGVSLRERDGSGANAVRCIRNEPSGSPQIKNTRINRCQLSDNGAAATLARK